MKKKDDWEKKKKREKKDNLLQNLNAKYTHIKYPFIQLLK